MELIIKFYNFYYILEKEIKSRKNLKNKKKQIFIRFLIDYKINKNLKFNNF